MIFDDVQTWFISGADDKRLIRYDIIKIDSDTYLVKVFDEQQKGIAQPKIILEIDEFQLTKKQYVEEYEIGQNRTIKLNMSPAFESYPRIKCQDHRNKLS
ncbi:hypothetical protein MXM81_00035 [Serratia plymuthica]|uniref:hypothetical protein n=1 Tax=Serratia plymuthica TaxID=82996 RepID=UPI002DB82C9F|nr:hypothetical protein [Serratia plymuthica]MEB6537476.1 hypothetical protein [Serratia plymuthica]